jgi:hypothetical protein
MSEEQKKDPAIVDEAIAVEDEFKDCATTSPTKEDASSAEPLHGIKKSSKGHTMMIQYTSPYDDEGADCSIC